MKYFSARILLSLFFIISILILPQNILATHNNDIRDQCSDFDLDADCQLVKSVSSNSAYEFGLLHQLKIIR